MKNEHNFLDYCLQLEINYQRLQHKKELTNCQAVLCLLCENATYKRSMELHKEQIINHIQTSQILTNDQKEELLLSIL
jgi:hypothetical protein